MRSNNNCCCYCCNAFLPSFIPGMQSKSKNKNNIAAAAYIFFPNPHSDLHSFFVLNQHNSLRPNNILFYAKNMVQISCVCINLNSSRLVCLIRKFLKVRKSKREITLYKNAVLDLLHRKLISIRLTSIS